MSRMSDATQTPDPADTPAPDEDVFVPHGNVQLMEAQLRAEQRFVTAQSNPHVPTQEEQERVFAFRQAVVELATMIEFLAPECRDKSLALTHLEDALTRASRAVFVQDPIGGRRPALIDAVTETSDGLGARLEDDDLPDPGTAPEEG